MKSVKYQPQDLILNEEIVLKEEERQPCEVWSRVMGYHRPTTSFNKGKRGEFSDRQYFKEEKAIRKIR